MTFKSPKQGDCKKQKQTPSKSLLVMFVKLVNTEGKKSIQDYLAQVCFCTCINIF